MFWLKRSSKETSIDQYLYINTGADQTVVVVRAVQNTHKKCLSSASLKIVAT